MATTTFTGPVTAGSVLDTTGSLPGTIRNVGGVTLAQTSPVTQTATGAATSIVIPAGSTILETFVGVTTVWSGAATTFTIGTTAANANELANGSGANLGVSPVAPTTQAQTNAYLNVGATDVVIYIKSANAGTGVGYLTVQYLQGPNNID